MSSLDIDGTYTFTDYMLFIAAALAGKISGAEGNTIVIRDILDAYDIIRATVDGNGNRTNVEFYPT